jgi:protein-S-isoprenylcysteine O-methyltransferase Ste14
MMAFFIAVYLLIKGHAGTVPILMPHLRYALEAFGAVLMIGGCVVNVLGRYSLGQNWADQATLYSSQTLVTSGVFAITRHPLYSSLVWMFYGSALLYHNYAVTLATTFIFIPAMYYRAAIEERLLSARFDDYRSYQNRVGRLFPRLALRGGQNQ